MFILEHANKRNFKAIVRHVLNRQTWGSYDLDPVEFVALNFDFHPEHIRRALGQAGFTVQQRLPVSLFRLEQLKDKISDQYAGAAGQCFPVERAAGDAECVCAQRRRRQHAE